MDSVKGTDVIELIEKGEENEQVMKLYGVLPRSLMMKDVIFNLKHDDGVFHFNQCINWAK